MIMTKRFSTGLASFILLLAAQSLHAQESLSGAGSDGSSTNATFSATLSSDGGETFSSSSVVASSIEISGTISPDANDVGAVADIYVVLVRGGQILIRNQQGVFELYTGAVEDLSPAYEGVTLENNLSVELFAGTYSEEGEYLYYFGYQISDQTPLVYNAAPAVFEIVPVQPNVIAQSYAVLGEDVSFTLNPELLNNGVTYTWEFNDGSVSTGTEVVHSYEEVNRFLVSVTRSDSEEIYYHHINIGRAFENTLYPQAISDSLTPIMVNRDFSWNECDADWEVYESKYHKLYVESSSSEQVTDVFIIRILLFSDWLFDRYSDIIGWEFMHEPEALDTYLCDDIPGGGTGTGGSFYGIGVAPESNQDFRGASDFGYLPHEMIHLWDFRGGVWLNSQDPPHALTTGFEAVLGHALGFGYNQSAIIDERNVGELDPDYIFNHYSRIYSKRYQDNPSLDWYSYNSEEFLDLAYEFLPIPENKEHMMVPGSLLMSLYSMHGLDSLTALYSELEKIMLANPDWRNGGVGYNNLDKLQRVQNFVDASAHALKLDVSDYFEYWKYPAVDDSVTSLYPKSDRLNDGDGDGFSPLQGDLDDSNAAIYPYAPELVDGIDNNLDGLIDENVYTEESGDITELAVTMPFAVQGSISSLSDVDVFTFTAAKSGYLLLNIYSKDSDTSVEYEPGAGRDASIFMGAALMDDNYLFPVILDAISAPHVFGAWFVEAGPHTLTLTTELEETDIRNPNPGDYEVQVFFNEHEPAFFIDELLGDVYEGKSL